MAGRTFHAGFALRSRTAANLPAMTMYDMAQHAAGDAADVLDVLHDAQAGGSPIPFERTAVGAPRLDGGSRAYVQGRLAGWTVALDVEVRSTDAPGPWRRSRGPIELDVRYALTPDDGERDTRALRGRVLSQADDLPTARTILRRAVAGIARDAEARALRRAVAA